MKKLLILLPAFFLAITSVFAALQFSLSSYNVEVPKGGVANVTLIATNNGNPVPDVDLMISKYCRETTPPKYKCNSGDVYSPSEIAIVTDPKTNSEGKANIAVSHDGSNNIGDYHFTVCREKSGECSVGGASVTGDFFSVPEFTAIGAGLALVGAGTVYFMRRRK